MINCKICLKKTDQGDYHAKCLNDLFGNKKVSLPITFNKRNFYQTSRENVSGRERMSISGVQPKAQLEIINNELEIVPREGRFIIKPSPEEFEQAAENEHLSMLLAKIAGFAVPPNGLFSFQDGELTYIVKRFDRTTTKLKLHHEDMLQMMGASNSDSENKYTYASYAEVLNFLKELGGLALAAECFKRIVFCYLIGNNDYHLKNISVLHGKRPTLTPFYDVINADIYSKGATVMALSLTENDENLPYYATMGNGYYARSDFMQLASSVGIPNKVADKYIDNLVQLAEPPSSVALPSQIKAFVNFSYLSEKLKSEYQEIVEHRVSLLNHA